MCFFFLLLPLSPSQRTFVSPTPTFHCVFCLPTEDLKREGGSGLNGRRTDCCAFAVTVRVFFVFTFLFVFFSSQRPGRLAMQEEAEDELGQEEVRTFSSVVGNRGIFCMRTTGGAENKPTQGWLCFVT